MKTLWLITGVFCSLSFAVSASEVALTVEEPAGVARSRWPITSGVPFAQGALRDTKAVTLRSTAGKPIPMQADVLARWPDGSIRWLLLDFQMDLAAGEKQRVALHHESSGQPHSPGVPSQVRVTRSDGRMSIDTGPLRMELDSSHLDPFGVVWLDQNGDGRFGDAERVTRAGGGLFVRDTAGRRYEAAGAAADITLEESGPLRACVRITGRHTAEGAAMFSYVLRIHAFAGQPFVRCHYTFINDHQDAAMTSVAELGVALRLADAEGNARRHELGGHNAGDGRIFQIEENRYELDGRSGGTRARGWAAVSGARAGVAAGVREFWQQWPKSIEARDGEIRLGLCPELPGPIYDGTPLTEENKLYYSLRRGVHTFKVGVAKTHELWVNFFRADSGAALDRFFDAAGEPLLATAEPAYVNATRVAGELPPADANKYFGYDAWFGRAMAGHLRRREQVREFGMLNFGDWYGERQVNWGNLEYDLQRGMFLQYLRTGDRRFFERGAQAARHHIDVDVVHAVNPHVKNPFGLPPKVGEIWLHSVGHTGGYYLDAPLPVERPYQMGHSANYGHVWISGDLDYYYLTGDRRAREVALGVADMMATAMTAKVGTHIRTLGWPTILVLAAYEATGDAKYLEAATRNWHALKESLDPQRGWVVKLASDHCLHPEGSTRQERDTKYREQRCVGNVPFMEGLTLCALARYHRFSRDAEVLKAISIGVEQMIRECWQEDVKTFRYTACPLSSKASYGLFMLCVEAMAYEARLTGNSEHERILREGFRSAVTKTGAEGFGKGLAQMTFFAPHALWALEDGNR